VGVHAEAYLAGAFERLGTHRDLYGLAIDDMTPTGFKKILR
jgi:hypothetical protein